MKSLKSVFLTAALTIGAFGAVTYTACTKDACKDVVCKNGGTCVSGSCVCPTGFQGTNCQTKSFFGSWKGSDQCTSGTYNNITVTLAPGSTDSTSVIVTNPGGFGASVTVNGTLSSDAKTIAISNQSVGGGRNMTGTMSLVSATSFNINYTVTPTSGTADNCNGSYTKQ
ncbi:MAG: calcium-binding EGF-like domain-containing protein [Bacteroidetes bacterium]|nr:calcium-binding EGF-like domain-containing protein [Bacteroidota bacterium]